MKIGLVAPPFIPVPPQEYGGTELFIAHLAEALKVRGVDVVVYTNGESTVGVEKRWIFEDAQWPPKKGIHAQLRQAEHDGWAIHDASTACDVIHLNSFDSLPFTKFIHQPLVCTLHHPHDPVLSAFYQRYPEVQYVSISNFQQQQEPMPRNRTIHHGIDLKQYRLQEKKQQYLSFIGRIAPNDAHLGFLFGALPLNGKSLFRCRPPVDNDSRPTATDNLRPCTIYEIPAINSTPRDLQIEGDGNAHPWGGSLPDGG